MDNMRFRPQWMSFLRCHSYCYLNCCHVKISAKNWNRNTSFTSKQVKTVITFPLHSFKTCDCQALKMTRYRDTRSRIAWFIVLNLCFFNFVSSQDLSLPTQIKVPGSRGQNGMSAMVSGAIGAGIGAAIGSIDGPFRAATLGSAGGTLGGLFGGFQEEEKAMTVIGSVAGGYLGGLVGGFLGGAAGEIAEDLSMVLGAIVLGAGAAMAGSEAYGEVGGILGGIGGALLGAGLGKLVVGPPATILTGGLLGALGGGAGSFLGSTDFIGRPR